jgi:hypothetical protein
LHARASTHIEPNDRVWQGGQATMPTCRATLNARSQTRKVGRHGTSFVLALHRNGRPGASFRKDGCTSAHH